SEPEQSPQQQTARQMVKAFRVFTVFRNAVIRRGSNKENRTECNAQQTAEMRPLCRLRKMIEAVGQCIRYLESKQRLSPRQNHSRFDQSFLDLILQLRRFFLLHRTCSRFS